MASRLDDLMAPERLRQRWATPSQQAPVPTPSELRNRAVQAHWDELLDLLAARFVDTAPIRVPLEQAARELTAQFPLEPPYPAPSPAERAALVARIEELEELIWALELAEPEHAG